MQFRRAAIAAALAVGFGVGAATLPIAEAVTSTGERTVYTAITPCRLADFRPEFQVGPKRSPLGPGETARIAARGEQGRCSAADLPADAVALQLNVTALDATLPTFLAISPDGSSDTSSLNPVPGAPPTPNAVTVRLASDGSFTIFNLQGSVNAIVDVTGFYTDHHHDDRYYTEAEVDALLDSKADRQKIALPATGANYINGAAYQSTLFWAGIRLDDASLHGVRWTFALPTDYVPGSDGLVRLQWLDLNGGCAVSLQPSVSSRSRPGTGPVNGFIAEITPTPSLGDTVTSESEFTIDGSMLAGQPGDIINLGFFRSSVGDTCTGSIILHGGTVEFV